MNGTLNKINQTPISIDEMKSYLKALEQEPDASLGRAVMVAKNVFNDNFEKCMSVNMRMTALVKLIDSEQLPGWVKPSTDHSSFMVAPNVYAAAGVEPLVEKDSALVFDKDALLKRAFQLGSVD